MTVLASKADKTYSLTQQSAPDLSAAENFQKFLNTFAESFYLVDESGSGPKETDNFEFSTVFLRCGVARVLYFSASPFALCYSLKRNRYHGYVNLLYVLQGQLTINIAGHSTYQISSDCAFLCDPRQELLLRTTRGTTVGSVLLATNWFHEQCGHLSDHFAEVIIKDEIVESRVFLAAAKSFFTNIGQIGPQEVEGYLEGLCRLLNPMFRKIFVIRESVFGSKKDFLRACAVEAMLRHLADSEADLSVIAHETGISQRYLGELFRELGTTPHDKWVEMRLERASTQLRTTAFSEKNIAEIARFNGFVNVSHFGKLFKKRFLMTPKEWRSKP